MSHKLKESQGLNLKLEDDFYGGLKWLVVIEPYVSGMYATGDGIYGEVLRLRWTEDLKHWVGSHKAEIESGDINPLLEYRRLLRKSLS